MTLGLCHMTLMRSNMRHNKLVLIWFKHINISVTFSSDQTNCEPLVDQFRSLSSLRSWSDLDLALKSGPDVSSATATGNVVVVTRVRQDVGHVLPPLPGTEDPADTYIFNRARPVVFGIVQIIVSLIILVLGIVMQQHTGTLVIHSGIFVWGPVMFFIAGFLTVAAGTSSSSSLIKSAMTFNTIAAVVSIVATVIYFLGVSAILTTDSSFPPLWEP
ncbi:high affinity immunoglobulin epsilon receptor subunit beta-like isoform X3 [Lates japonicus]|nr:high affinity immunoglobulin epsilon receptor subunit beta-like isoform X3 [Lates japonicus]